jgi:hypothetical protein
MLGTAGGRRGTTKESSRLGNREEWSNLASGLTATRMRHGGKRKERPVIHSSSSSDGEWREEADEEEEEDDEDIEDEAHLLRHKEKPMHKRVILEVRHVEQAFEKFCRCPECGNPLLLQLETVCIATRIVMHCHNRDCTFMSYSPGPCAKTTMHEDDGYERMTDQALNVLYALSFITMGDGHTEAARL